MRRTITLVFILFISTFLNGTDRFIRANEAAADFLRKQEGDWTLVYINPRSIEMVNPVTMTQDRKLVYEVWAKLGSRNFLKKRVLYKLKDLYAIDIKIKVRMMIDRRGRNGKYIISPKKYIERTEKIGVIKIAGISGRIHYQVLKRY